MKNISNKSLKLLSLPFLLVSALSAATYTDNYRVTDLNKTIIENNNRFMNNDFQEIIRYEMLVFDGNQLNKKSKQILQRAVEKIHTLEKEKLFFTLTLIGHTNRVSDDQNELKIDSDSYANKIQNYFRDSLDTNESLQLSKRYAQKVQKLLEDENISHELIDLEYRGGNDALYTNASSEGKRLSNGVMLSIYVNQADNIDSDEDGVFDSYDRCQGTPKGYAVNKNGCSTDSDQDKVLDYKDSCLETPLGVNVDAQGCPLDSDNDTIPNYKDKCANTPAGATIDFNGCSIKNTLNLTFASNSARILKQSYPKIKAFADFLKKNSLYHITIIGHTDSVGDAEANMKLSKKRAASTKEILVHEGIEASRIDTTGRGELNPIKSNKLKSGREANRRIEIKLSIPTH